MNYTTLTIGSTEYKLRLTTRSLVAMEKALGQNPINIFMKIEDELPKTSDLAIMLWSCLQTLNHGITIDKTYDLIDAYMADGNQMFDLIPAIIETFQAAGFLGANEEPATDSVDPN